MVYKTLKKVSNVCQLFIPDDTHTVAGVTITDNRDGSLTIDGIGTGSGTYTNFTALGKDNMPYKIGDKLFVSAYVISGTCSFLFAGFSQSGNPNITFTNASEGTYYSGNISTQNSYNIMEYLGFYVGNNTFNNFRVKFNIINLTEMYGAGNEPTTVEQFRQDFPEELYDYKPYCFVKSYKTLLKASDNKIITSYKKSLICTTKNLFDINKSSNASSDENSFDTFSINNNVITATSDNSTTKIATLNIFKGELPAGDYILSLNAVIENTPKHNRPNEIFIFKNGSFLTLDNSMPTDGSYSIKIKFTLSEKATISIEWYKSVGSSQETVSDTVYKVTLSNIQLELGDTATEYHPYGYL